MSLRAAVGLEPDVKAYSKDGFLGKFPGSTETAKAGSLAASVTIKNNGLTKLNLLPVCLRCFFVSALP